jgi:hypothetical protein
VWPDEIKTIIEAPLRYLEQLMRSKPLERPENFPKYYREMVSRYLMEKYGDKISIRSAIIKPPTHEKIIKEGKIVKLFKGAVSFNVVDRNDKDFGRHDMTYVMQNDEITLQEGES